jgi:drug/metabolite transporter (DMT)-like permease
MWPLVAARAASVPVFFLITVLRKLPVSLGKESIGYAVLAGALDMGANVFYLLAARTGFMVTAVIISSLYPAPTVLLQRIVRGEKLSFLRVCGIVLAITGAALIGVGS